MDIFRKIFNDENNYDSSDSGDLNIISDVYVDSKDVITKLSNIKKNIQNNNQIMISNRYMQNNLRYHCIPNVIHINVCKFIIEESEKYAEKHGWTTSRHINYPTTDIPVKSIKTIINLVDNLIKYDIFPLFQKYYNINKYFLDYGDIFIVKYDIDFQNKLEKHRDGNLFSFNVLLNSPSEFTGGGTIFEINGTDILVNNTQGGIVLHNGQLLHAGNEITNGKRYLLVGFIKYLPDY